MSNALLNYSSQRQFCASIGNFEDVCFQLWHSREIISTLNIVQQSKVFLKMACLSGDKNSTLPLVITSEIQKG